MSPSSSIANTVRLRSEVTCAHCWFSFPPQDTLWVSTHDSLAGADHVLKNTDEQLRFLPSHFSAAGHAIDPKGEQCTDLACPRCHLPLPRGLLELPPIFISILGAPSSGKSYLLASMVWQMRRAASDFRIRFDDADPSLNAFLLEYEEKFFLAAQDDQWVTLPKTEQEGDLYVPVQIDERDVLLARPFVFAVQPLQGHPNLDRRDKLSRLLCVYDNAGEHFLPGQDSANQPGTGHLAQSKVLLFLFDPTQHPRLRTLLRKGSQDPQLNADRKTYQQHQILLEAANRIRRHTQLPQNEQLKTPLVVILTKYDVWGKLLGDEHFRADSSAIAKLDIDQLRAVSAQIEKLLAKHCPEFTNAVDGCCSDVVYVPVSAVGGSPEEREIGQDTNTGQAAKQLLIRPRDISPMWAEVPLLYALQRAVPGLIAAKSSSGTKEQDDE